MQYVLCQQKGTFLDNIVYLSLSCCSLNACNLTVTCCEILANGISSSQLRELDLGNNNLTDAGIIPLSGGLKNSKLETLRSKPNKFLHFFTFFFTPKSVKDVFIHEVVLAFSLFSVRLD